MRTLLSLSALFAFMSAIIVLITQPMSTALVNDRYFAGLFIIGLLFAMTFMKRERRRTGTISSAKAKYHR